MDVLDGRAPRARAGSLIQMGRWLQVASLRLEADQQKARTEDGGRSIKKDFAPVSREHSFRYPAIEAIHSRWLARGPVHAGTPLA